jgi:hypothetical protein
MSLADVYKKVATFLNDGGYNYVVIGGIAAGTLGEPRVTADVDVDIVMNKEDVAAFLDEAAKAGFEVVRDKCLESAKQVGVFQIGVGEYHVDFIIASTDLETHICNRRTVIKLYGVDAFFPSPEDLILLKIIPGRKQDFVDAEKVVMRHKGKLDIEYLTTWARKLSDEAEDMRIWNTLNELLGEK